MLSPEGCLCAATEGPQGAGRAVIEQLRQEGSLVLSGSGVQAAIWQPRHCEPLDVICNSLHEFSAILGCEEVHMSQDCPQIQGMHQLGYTMGQCHVAGSACKQGDVDRTNMCGQH